MSDVQTTLILVDDHKILRQGLRALLADDPTISVIGEAGDGRSGVDLAASSCPDVAIVDVALLISTALKRLVKFWNTARSAVSLP